ncbi:MAG: uncharacterized protein QOG63_1169 [Thermoleophilaceae bacterium]|jgi:uncharacterized membrane protein YedE/YeeE|nr:uncharacterized protein [Thermoleophilaceae bacterium]
MTRVKAAALGFGAAFGLLISWGQFTDPDRIRDMLLLEDPYLYLMMFSAMAVGTVGVRGLRRRRARALLTGEEVTLERARPERRHAVGAAIFGLGWAVADTCPAPVAAQLTQGVWWSAFTIAGVVVGVIGYLRWQERRPPTRALDVPAADSAADGLGAR